MFQSPKTACAGRLRLGSRPSLIASQAIFDLCISICPRSYAQLGWSLITLSKECGERVAKRQKELSPTKSPRGRGEGNEGDSNRPMAPTSTAVECCRQTGRGESHRS